MSKLYLCEPPKDDIDTICFDHDSAFDKYHSIKMDDGRRYNLMLSSATDYSWFNPIKLFHALLSAIDLGWFVPNKESIALPKKICNRYNIS
jgi:hypothetical protein